METLSTLNEPPSGTQVGCFDIKRERVSRFCDLFRICRMGLDHQSKQLFFILIRYVQHRCRLCTAWMIETNNVRNDCEAMARNMTVGQRVSLFSGCINKLLFVLTNWTPSFEIHKHRQRHRRAPNIIITIECGRMVYNIPEWRDGFVYGSIITCCSTICSVCESELSPTIRNVAVRRNGIADDTNQPM